MGHLEAESTTLGTKSELGCRHALESPGASSKQEEQMDKDFKSHTHLTVVKAKGSAVLIGRNVIPPASVDSNG